MCDLEYCDGHDCSDCANELDLSHVTFSPNGDLLITNTIPKDLITFLKSKVFFEFRGGFNSDERTESEIAEYSMIMHGLNANLLKCDDDAWHETYVHTTYFKALIKQLNL